MKGRKDMTITIGKLAKQFNLSRSTLLYYDSIGLLSPNKRAGSNYRMYSKEDCKRLEQIAIYRQAGLSLEQIKEIVDNAKCDAAVSLEAKLQEINEKIDMLRQQQHFIIEILQNSKLLEQIGTMQKDVLVELLESAGVDETTQWKFHHQFEKKFPEKHEAFLQFLTLSPEQISKIRDWSRKSSL